MAWRSFGGFSGQAIHAEMSLDKSKLSSGLKNVLLNSHGQSDDFQSNKQAFQFDWLTVLFHELRRTVLATRVEAAKIPIVILLCQHEAWQTTLLHLQTAQKSLYFFFD